MAVNDGMLIGNQGKEILPNRLLDFRRQMRECRRSNLLSRRFIGVQSQG
nr:hypothetical protein Iba_chr07aCG4660 [Ipomoea batatas]